MADSEEVLKELDPPDDVEIIGIVVNEKGAQRAIATEAVRTLGFPYSVSPTFLAEQSEPDARRRDRRTGEDQEQGRGGRARHGGLHFDGIRQSLRRSLEHRRSGRCGGPARIARRSHDLAGRHGGHGRAGADSRTGFSGEFKVRLSGDWRAPAQPSRAGGGEGSGRV